MLPITVPTVADLLISELFHSIQGETSRAGLPCTFIRTAGCNLRCSYCDASYTYNEAGRRMALSEVTAFAERWPAGLVAVTGGEPLLQETVIDLLQDLVRHGHRVLLETNGSCNIAPVPPEVIIILDVKCPGSAMHHHFDPANLARLRPDDEIKFVLSHRDDYLWSRRFIEEHNLAGRELLLSPVPDRLPAADLAAWILEDNLPCRLQLQLHKILWPDTNRGV